MSKAKRPRPLPLHAQICARHRDALLRRILPSGRGMNKQELLAMLWEHRVMDILYRNDTDDYPSLGIMHSSAYDAGDDMPF